MKAEIWQNHRQLLIAWLSKQGLNQADGEDLTQDILFKAWQKQDQLQQEENLKAWLFGIARNRLIDHFRQKQIPLSEFLTDETDTAPLQEMEGCLEPFINDLPEKEQALLRHIDLAHVRQKDYAEAQNIPYSTLKSQLKKARQLLAKRYQQCCHMEFDPKGRVSQIEQKQKNCDC
ncbi:sigma-70 family RNA polymerase sigma factor [Terasakiella sp. SH-1]|uniref:sigma-70 family RNA polymerase sigma factor n=1 Tax=Terasakiella sp. SH-1 TaxID=2560057 RepID=UPI001073819B|nr:sigma-70 family RNA polymerase sigma factor [Terasakiella sp. SH-1]